MEWWDLLIGGDRRVFLRRKGRTLDALAARDPRAVEVARSALRSAEGIYGSKSVHLAESVYHLATALSLRHRFREASAAFARAVRLAEEYEGFEHFTVLALEQQASCTAALGDFAEAERLLDDAAARREADGVSASTWHMLATRAFLARRQGALDAAIDLEERALAILEQRTETGGPYRGGTVPVADEPRMPAASPSVSIANIVGDFLATGRRDAARARTSSALRAVGESYGENSHVQRDVLFAVVQRCFNEGNFELAVELLRAAIAEAKDTGREPLSVEHETLAVAYMLLGRSGPALAELDRAFELADKDERTRLCSSRATAHALEFEREASERELRGVHRKLERALRDADAFLFYAYARCLHVSDPKRASRLVEERARAKNTPVHRIDELGYAADWFAQRGAMDRARALLAEAEKLARLDSAWDPVTYAHVVATLHGIAGRFDSARAALARPDARPRGAYGRARRAACLAGLAEMECDYPNAAELVAGAVALHEETGAGSQELAVWLATLQLYAFEAGRADAPAIDLDRLDASVAQLPSLHPSCAHAALARALVCEIDSNSTAAVEHAKDALRRTEPVHGPRALFATEALAALARLTRTSHPDEARGYANRAVELALSIHGEEHPQADRFRRLLDP